MLPLYVVFSSSNSKLWLVLLMLITQQGWDTLCKQSNCITGTPPVLSHSYIRKRSHVRQQWMSAWKDDFSMKLLMNQTNHSNKKEQRLPLWNMTVQSDSYKKLFQRKNNCQNSVKMYRNINKCKKSAAKIMVNMLHRITSDFEIKWADNNKNLTSFTTKLRYYIANYNFSASHIIIIP